ncbi:hypothetical protein ACU4GA_13425 [Methylobacterium oryzae CBMB20]
MGSSDPDTRRRQLDRLRAAYEGPSGTAGPRGQRRAALAGAPGTDPRGARRPAGRERPADDRTGRERTRRDVAARVGTPDG